MKRALQCCVGVMLASTLGGCASLNGWQSERELRQILDRNLTVGMTIEAASYKIAQLGATIRVDGSLEADHRRKPDRETAEPSDVWMVEAMTDTASVPIPMSSICAGQIRLYFDESETLTHWFARRTCMGP